ncbi:LCP family protein [Corynebacterium sp. 153RC1]|nr:MULTISPECIES: LCP family protein [unclassified Corynebacterium]MCQ9370023.1 LCP family protein [Corynebacterium sp. 35RC1]MCQ9352135.1 LCP family protein [Corynebacterium sp. 209RC1]MCQ9354137.1 LCP family protein [Corynebacterium sp. 1222RC1]MCQ9356417.1 LCP family protein [Corynebacterium sp. 122RC1]MCQ9358519.1 LCP family protein [Corynebacterium sp. 142RC1]
MTDRYRRTRDIQAPPQLGPQTTQMGHKGVKATVALLSAACLTVSALGYYTVGQLGNTVASAGNLALGGDQGMKQPADGAVDILLVGSDSRADAHGNPLSQEELAMLNAGDEENDNTDTLMVIRVPNDGSSATAISIPRDTYIHDAEYGNMKINGVFKAHKDAETLALTEQGVTDQTTLELRAREAGRQALIEQISTLSGITVDHYAEVGLLGFVLLTDAVGGVEVCLNEATQDEFSGADFAAGVQTLNGSQALSFVRQRHGLPRGDLDRIVRQQAYMASLVNSVLSSGTLTNPSKLNEMGQAVERSVIIDEGWDIMAFATQLQNLAGGNVTFNTIPVTSIDGVGDYGESVVTINQNEVHTFFEQLLGTGTGDAAETSTQAPQFASDVTVLNASGIDGLASAVAAALSQNGENIIEVGNANNGSYISSQVVAANANSEEARRIAEFLGLPVVENSSLDERTIMVITAADYAGPTEYGVEPIINGQSATDTGSTEETIGQPGADAGEAIVSPEINAGGTGPRCVN